MSSPSTQPGSAEDNRPPPKDLSHLYSDVSKARIPNQLKQLYKYFFIPGIGQLAGGLPHSSYFPFDTLEAQTAEPQRWKPVPNDPMPGKDGLDDFEVLQSQFSRAHVSPKPAAKEDAPAAAHLIVPHDDSVTDPFKRIDLATALQYGQATGYPPLLSFVRQFAREVLHPNVPYKGGPEVILTVGSTDGNSKVLELFVNNWVEGKNDIRDRPGLVTETFMYSSVLSQARPRGVNVVAVAMDDEGMLPYGPGGLEDVMSNWDYSKGRRPHLMYSVTMGHNPTGGVLSVARRKQLYALASRFDIIIIEDDPYWYLQYPSAEVAEATARRRPIPESKLVNPFQKKSGYDFVDSLVPSYLSVDTDGRVVRLDTFSKTIAPGCRLGFITAAPAIVDRILRIAEASTAAPSGFVQVFIAQALMGRQPEATTKSFAAKSAKEQLTFSGWRTDGWVRWVAGLRGEYERRMMTMAGILEDGCWQLKQSTPTRDSEADWGVITKTQLYDFAWPRGGMFLWLHMRFETHPLWKAPRKSSSPASHGGGGIALIDGPTLSTALMVYLTHKPHLVLVSPGAIFSATDEIRAETGWAYYRLCFAAESTENIELCSRRFVEGVHRFWRIKSVRELEDLINEANSDAAVAAEGEGLTNLSAWMGC
ncbi:pyridoxal phosphate-dependent transferase [Microdochium trichocladiopsis]|uniref:Pyridoxal phosphate-dependent transferase n=1 Tax=Microdochium trichocladiopsis TaxID=1682393 RepID=A0A9P8Y952_9PEZI|nr:pyridoxal phosphate-dependent transferase [Microdochium trichocladiopsis]KAH7033258.1 pyridoxal phosphate-dependent transferase [Microdochium trichocladiopsis]